MELAPDVGREAGLVLGRDARFYLTRLFSPPYKRAFVFMALSNDAVSKSQFLAWEGSTDNGARPIKREYGIHEHA